MMRFLIMAAALGAGLALGSCATMSEDQCLAGAWGEVGLADGRAGYGEDRLASHAEACAKVGVVPDEAVYFAAREEGLRSYCVPANGFRVGRDGSSYAGVCPASVEGPFLSAYRDGQVLGAAERAVSDAASRVSSYASRAANAATKAWPRMSASAPATASTNCGRSGTTRFPAGDRRRTTCVGPSASCRTCAGGWGRCTPSDPCVFRGRD
jgi:hypothetical protein